MDDGQRGNHLFARDLLTITGVLDVPAPKKAAADQITIQIGCGSDAEFIPIEAPEPAPVQVVTGERWSRPHEGKARASASGSCR